MDWTEGQVHLTLFGTPNEQKYFLDEKYKRKIELIGFNSNLVAYYPAAISGFVAQLVNKNYFISPQLFAFQMPVSSIMKKRDGVSVVKPSIKRLAEILGAKINELVGKNELHPSDLLPDDLEMICENSLKFQNTVVSETLQETEDWVYFSELSPGELQPSFSISPSLKIDTDNYEEQLRINNELLKSTIRIVSNNDYSKEVFAELIIENGVLSKIEAVSYICDNLDTDNIDGILLWIDDLAETEVNLSVLKDYIYFLRLLNKLKKPIIMLHGGFLSVILTHKDIDLLKGVGHGVEYGESRSITPVGGGVPASKFYFPIFHKRIDYQPDTLDILLEKEWIKSKEIYFEKVCMCGMCKEIMDNSPSVQEGFNEYGETKISDVNGKAYPTGAAKDKSRRHYLNKKYSEFEFVKKSSINQIIQYFLNSEGEAQEVKTIHSFNHLGKWRQILEEISTTKL